MELELELELQLELELELQLELSVGCPDSQHARQSARGVGMWVVGIAGTAENGASWLAARRGCRREAMPCEAMPCDAGGDRGSGSGSGISATLRHGGAIAVSLTAFHATADQKLTRHWGCCAGYRALQTPARHSQLQAAAVTSWAWLSGGRG